jgi:23S rRNA pseudouridine1911/1915/1917 synthase
VVNKPAGMMVHAGSGATDDARNRGTLVNALLFHFAKLSDVGGDLRPGIVHRLDKQTSGILLVAKDDSTHRKLGEMFSQRQVTKTYIALVHGNLAKDNVTISLPIGRDLVRRIRMTTRRSAGEGVRTAVSHVKVLERIASPYGPFTLVEVRIETGRTHQIRVHMQSLGHPVVGDTLYGAPHILRAVSPSPGLELSPELGLDRNFLHAAHLSFTHPQTSKPMDIDAPLPAELDTFLSSIRAGLRKS